MSVRKWSQCRGCCAARMHATVVVGCVGESRVNEHLLCCCIISRAVWAADMKKLRRESDMCSITSRGPSLSFMTLITQTGARKEVGPALWVIRVSVCRNNILHSLLLSSQQQASLLVLFTQFDWSVTLGLHRHIVVYDLTRFSSLVKYNGSLERQMGRKRRRQCA